MIIRKHVLFFVNSKKACFISLCTVVSLNVALCRMSDQKEPDGLEFENCATLQLDRNKPVDQKSWRDVPCVLNSVHYYICEYANTKGTGRWCG